MVVWEDFQETNYFEIVSHQVKPQFEGGKKFDFFFFENFKIIANSHDARWMDDAKKKVKIEFVPKQKWDSDVSGFHIVRLNLYPKKKKIL